MIDLITASILVFAPITRGAVRIWAFGPIQIAIFLITCIYIINIRYGREIRFKKTALDIPIALFIFLCLLSFIRTGYLYSSIMEFLKFANLGLIFYITVNCIDEEYKIKRILNIILASATAIAMFGILQYLGVIPRDWWGRHNFLSATYVNHNHFGGYMELALPLSIGMILSERDIGKKGLYVYSFLALSSALLLSMSRGAWFSITIAMIFMFIMICRKKKGFFISLLFLAFLTVAVIFIFNAIDLSALSRRISSYKELDFSGRIEIWKGTLQIIKHNWLLGTGIGTFIYNFPAYRAPGLNMFVNFSHNDYLQIASEAGVFSLALLAFMIFAIIRKGIATHNIASTSFRKWLPLALVIGILSLSIHGLGDFNFYIPANALLFTVYAGLALNISSRKEGGPRYFTLRPNLAQYRLVKFSAVIALITAVLFIGASLSSEIYIGKSQAAMSRNDMEKAVRLAIIAERILPISSSGPSKLAEIYAAAACKSGINTPQKMDLLERSASSYIRALQLNPMDAWLWLGLGDVYSGLSKFKDADMAYRKAIELDPLNSYYLKKFARFLFNTREERLSSEFYKKAAYIMSKSRGLSKMPKAFIDGRGYKDIADNAFQAGDAKKALTFYKMAEEFLVPRRNPRALAREMNENCFLLGREPQPLDRGAPLEKEDVRICPTRAYLKLGMIREAIAEYNGARPSKRNKAIFMAGLADYYFRKGYFDTAMKFANSSLKIYPESPEAYQVIYKIFRETSHGGYPADLISGILHFNKIPVSYDIKPAGFEVEFLIQENLIKEGSVKNDIVLPAGMYEFRIKANAKAAEGVWPHMIVRFNGRDAMDTYVNDAEWKEYGGIVVIDSLFNSLEKG